MENNFTKEELMMLSCMLTTLSVNEIVMLEKEEAVVVYDELLSRFDGNSEDFVELIEAKAKELFDKLIQSKGQEIKEVEIDVEGEVE